jgi:hypothetical protein
MRVIVLSLAFALLAAPAERADPHVEVVDLFASMTAALTEDPPNIPGFLKGFDRKLPEYDAISRNVKGLVLGYWVSSSVDFVKDEGDGAKRSVDVDWYMELRSRVPDGPLHRRRQVLHCELLKDGKRWRIVSISPAAFFDQP